jgi:hypothetical protein
VSTDRGHRTWERERAAIDEAYSDYIKKIFEQYAIEARSGDNEAMQRFKLNLHEAYRARILAMSVLSDHD